MRDSPNPANPTRVAIVVPDLLKGRSFKFYNQCNPALVCNVELSFRFASAFRAAENLPTSAATNRMAAEKGHPIRAELLDGPFATRPKAAQMLALAHRAWHAALTLDPKVVKFCDDHWEMNSASLNQRR